jgi:hypothetical protein
MSLSANRRILRKAYNEQFGSISESTFRNLIDVYLKMESSVIKYIIQQKKDFSYLDWARHRRDVEIILNQRCTIGIVEKEYLERLDYDFLTTIKELLKPPEIIEDIKRFRQREKEENYCWSIRRTTIQLKKSTSY